MRGAAEGILFPKKVKEYYLIIMDKKRLCKSFIAVKLCLECNFLQDRL